MVGWLVGWFCYISTLFGLFNAEGVKYSSAHNMRQGKKKKFSLCRKKKAMYWKRVTYKLHDSYFRSMTITPAIPKIAEVTHSDHQISEEIAEAWRSVHISA